MYVGNLDSRVTKRELADEFRIFEVIKSMQVAKRPPSYVFIDFNDSRDAQEANLELNGVEPGELAKLDKVGVESRQVITESI